jgi:hypothetical protein
VPTVETGLIVVESIEVQLTGSPQTLLLLLHEDEAAVEGLLLFIVAHWVVATATRKSCWSKPRASQQGFPMKESQVHR